MADIKYVEEKGKKFKIDSDGEKYRISWSEELQLKTLEATRENTKWQRFNVYTGVILVFLLLILVVTLIFVFYSLDKINFFTGLLYK